MACASSRKDKALEEGMCNHEAAPWWVGSGGVSVKKIMEEGGYCLQEGS